MKTLKRNQRPFYYCLYSGTERIIDEYGNDSGEEIITYEDPVLMYANISPATGQSNTEQFGNLENYDKVIVTTDMDCPIDENSVLFIDKEPEFTTGVTIDYQESETVLGGDDVTPVSVSVPAYDYVVRRVAKSLNSISIAVKKVMVS
ncbi:MAG: hypothetical protein J6S14_02075 [Clostridia bacterium]|nr:hypothetical protein [Clostridia bacterium]